MRLDLLASSRRALLQQDKEAKKALDLLVPPEPAPSRHDAAPGPSRHPDPQDHPPPRTPTHLRGGAGGEAAGGPQRDEAGLRAFFDPHSLCE